MPTPRRPAFRIATTLLLATLLAPFALQAATPGHTEAARRLDAELSRTYAADEPGAAVLVVKDGETILRKGYGLASLELKVPIAPEMVFRLASISKQFTAVAILMLVEEGKLTLDTPVSAIVPECPPAAKDKVTIRHLLAHTSGVPSYTDNPAFFANIAKDHSHAELLAYVAEMPLQFAPGERFTYSNTGYYLLGMVIEKLSGMPYADFLQQRIFDKLQMRGAHYDLPEKVIPGRVAGYQPKGDTDGYAPAPYISMRAPFAAGALAASVDDLVRWNEGLLSGKLLKRATLEQAWTPYQVTGKVPSTYGFGWVIGDYHGHRVVHHDGGIHGFTSKMIFLPEDHLTAVVLSNGHRQGPDVFAERAVMRVLGQLDSLEPISLPVEKLARFEGVYQIDEKQRRVIRVRDGKLTSQRAGGTVFQLLPLSEREFLLEGQNDRMRFEVDSQGRPTAMTVLRWGQGPEEAPLTSEPLPADRQAIAVSAADMDKLVGDYELQPGFVLSVRRNGEKLTAQATGQDAQEIFAETPTKFFLRVVEAELIFVLENDRAQAVTLLQGGGMLVGKRIG